MKKILIIAVTAFIGIVIGASLPHQVDTAGGGSFFNKGSNQSSRCK